MYPIIELPCLLAVLVITLLPSQNECFSILPFSVSSTAIPKNTNRDGPLVSLMTLKQQNDNNDVNKETEEKCASSPLSPPTPYEEVTEGILPFDRTYSTHGIIGKNKFIVSREGEPKESELSNENLVKIVKCETNDLEVNTLVWKCLGYRFDCVAKTWTNEKCFPKWKEKHPTPPDLIGMTHVYTKEVDRVSLKSNQDLVRSVPVDWKQSLKEQLKPFGFKGYQYAELTPNKTRRAQCTNWLLYYRMELFGYTIEELKERRTIKRQEQHIEEERRKKEAQAKGEEIDEWKPPVKEVF